ncbi:MAG: thymidylate synthase [Betaproteobacteria bacterium TMED41]|nr:MAG: thymidylate synthase [Betaproteobacteria bacterium TMED41]
MKLYLDLVDHILKNGILKNDRTGVGTYSVFGWQMRFNLEKKIPVITTKKIHLKSVLEELLWFLSGNTNVRKLQKKGVSIWNEWANSDGELGPIYGKQWRSWPDPKPNMPENSIDQISDVIKQLKYNPDSRRMIVSAWNVSQIPQMALTPCHILFQFYVANSKLSCQIYQRSADVFLGVPFNITSYAILTYMMAHQTGYKTGDLIWTGGDCHLYKNHVEQAKTQLERHPFPLPELKFERHPKNIFSYEYQDFKFINYKHHPALKGSVAI